MSDLASVTNVYATQNTDGVSATPLTTIDAKSPDRGYKKKEKIPLTEQMLHEGWIENLKNEERTMKESITKCIDDGLTKDPVRAKEIYDFSFFEKQERDQQVSEEQWKRGISINQGLQTKLSHWKPHGPLSQNMRSAKDGPLPIEFLIKKEGRRRMDEKTTRALKSKISLKFPLASYEKAQVKQRPNVKQEVLDEFEKNYAENCDMQKTAKKNRAVSKDNMFDPNFKVPPEYLKDDHAYLEKPGKLKLKDIPGPKQISGKFSNIGEEILKIGSYQAKWMSTGNWQFKNYNNDGSVRLNSKVGHRAAYDKITKYDPNKHNQTQGHMRANSMIEKSKEIDRLGHNIKNQQISPQNDYLAKNTFNEKNFSIFKAPKNTDRGKFEVSYSPDREKLIRLMKEKRNFRNSTRTSMDGGSSYRSRNGGSMCGTQQLPPLKLDISKY